MRYTLSENYVEQLHFERVEWNVIPLLRPDKVCGTFVCSSVCGHSPMLRLFDELNGENQ